MDTPTQPKKNKRENIPGTAPVVECGRKLVALHWLTTSKGETRFAMSEVIPAKMNGREVEEWQSVYQGLSLWFDTPVECAEFLQACSTGLGAYKVRPRIEVPLDQ